MATLSDSLRPRCGIVTHRSIGPVAIGPRHRKPRRLVAHHQRDPAGEITRGVRHDVPTRRRRGCSCRRGAGQPTRRSSSSATTTGTWKIAPADDRTTLGLYGSTDPGVSTTRSTPAASAERTIVPRLPGSLMPWRTTANDADSSVAPTSVAAHPNDGDRRLRGLRRRDAFEDAVGQLEDLPGMSPTAVPAHRHELCVDLPPGAHRLGDQRLALDDEATLLVTRTAAPDQAPQFLNR